MTDAQAMRRAAAHLHAITDLSDQHNISDQRECALALLTEGKSTESIDIAHEMMLRALEILMNINPSRDTPEFLYLEQIDAAIGAYEEARHPIASDNRASDEVQK